MSPTIKEGTIPFDVTAAGKPCETWYKIVGDLSSPITPLVVVHGGPGLSHDYLITLSELNERYGIPVIFYDQLGTARSTHLREKIGDESFWTEELFHDELNNLVEKLRLLDSVKGYDVLGHSWGGMMGATWAGTKPEGLRKLILGNAPAFMRGWTDAYLRYRDGMPEDVKNALLEGEKNEDWEGKEYEAAMMSFLLKHCATVFPEELTKSFGFANEDNTVSMTMTGPNEFAVTGNLRDWTAAAKCKGIEVPTLVINGVNEGACDESIQPFLHGIKDVKWIKFEKSTHMPLYEEKELYLKTVGEWLLEK